MSERKFKVGDVCRIREWDDMAEEFGIDSFGSIPCMYSFIPVMKYLCGTNFTIKQIRAGHYSSKEGSEGSFAISADMLELLESESTALPITTEDFNAILNL